MSGPSGCRLEGFRSDRARRPGGAGGPTLQMVELRCTWPRSAPTARVPGSQGPISAETWPRQASHNALTGSFRHHSTPTASSAPTAGGSLGSRPCPSPTGTHPASGFVHGGALRAVCRLLPAPLALNTLLGSAHCVTCFRTTSLPVTRRQFPVFSKWLRSPGATPGSPLAHWGQSLGREGGVCIPALSHTPNHDLEKHVSQSLPQESGQAENRIPARRTPLPSPTDIWDGGCSSQPHTRPLEGPFQNFLGPASKPAGGQGMTGS